MVRHIVLAGTLALLGSAQNGQQTTPPTPLPDGPQQQQAIPDSPRPQAILPGAQGIAPGSGTTPDSNGDAAQDDVQKQAPGTALPETAAQKADDGPQPELPAPGEGAKAFTLTTNVNFVQVPFTVKDSKNQPVPGITWREIRIYENGYRQQMRLFTVDPFPLSVAIVIDQSVPFQTMTKINNAIGALQGAFTPYDMVAVFTYNNGPKQQTEFTAAQSARLAAAIERSKSPGREGAMVYTSGPLSQNINLNGGTQNNVMPLVNSSHGSSQSNQLNVPKEVHTLNDAILAAAVATSKAGPDRRRIVYVISDGKEYGSTAKYKDVVKFCQTNKVAVYATLVGESSLGGVGFLDRIHLPFMMRDNILPLYTEATGGQIDPEFRQKGIEQSFARITEEVRTQYTVGYYSHEPFIDGKYRNLEVRVLRPNLRVISKKGYYPTAEEARPMRAVPPSAPPPSSQQ
ncbi:VWA domain-containing protein [Granulicella sp. dw_53]|uniref:VWA domain-containing protein n=1 Tax=Granulicella sp. dw_53 TaxID=2719792 RepID=UPI001BD2D577|nr:VWA domain-containing protein [Granulicella sp. dw_53]